MTLRVDGDDFEFVSETRFADGRVERFGASVVDRVQYATADGRTEAAPLRPGEGLNGSYAEASAAVVVAALSGADVTEGASETVAGVLTTRYEIPLTGRSIAALSALPPEQLAWFDLDYPDEVDDVTVWIGGDNIHRVEIAHRGGATTRTTFFKLNGDITITPPPGPDAQPDD